MRGPVCTMLCKHERDCCLLLRCSGALRQPAQHSLIERGLLTIAAQPAPTTDTDCDGFGIEMLMATHGSVSDAAAGLGGLAQDFAEPAQGPQVPHAGGGLRQA